MYEQAVPQRSVTMPPNLMSGNPFGQQQVSRHVSNESKDFKASLAVGDIVLMLSRVWRRGIIDGMGCDVWAFSARRSGILVNNEGEQTATL